mmetsp:Transcript_3926/g.10583  ORF Transcript_3926/g.10583 Transcript_3926/m.10583 type:complete len:402 (+) Transcript_3926:406-1611(+)
MAHLLQGVAEDEGVGGGVEDCVEGHGHDQGDGGRRQVQQERVLHEALAARVAVHRVEPYHDVAHEGPEDGRRHEAARRADVEGALQRDQLVAGLLDDHDALVGGLAIAVRVDGDVDVGQPREVLQIPVGEPHEAAAALKDALRADVVVLAGARGEGVGEVPQAAEREDREGAHGEGARVVPDPDAHRPQRGAARNLPALLGVVEPLLRDVGGRKLSDGRDDPEHPRAHEDVEREVPGQGGLHIRRGAALLDVDAEQLQEADHEGPRQRHPYAQVDEGVEVHDGHLADEGRGGLDARPSPPDAVDGAAEHAGQQDAEQADHDGEEGVEPGVAARGDVVVAIAFQAVAQHLEADDERHEDRHPRAEHDDGARALVHEAHVQRGEADGGHGRKQDGRPGADDHA